MDLCRTKVDGMDFFYSKNDAFVGQRIALGKYEEYETKLISEKVESNSVVVDVGANIGYYTMIMAKRAKKVFAIEPDEENYEILKKNIEANKLNNVVLIRAAASDKREKIRLYKSLTNNGDHRVYNTGDRRYVEELFSVALDEILLNEQKIDLIKIDTQGWEPKVLVGAKKVIERDSPILFMEYWPEGYREAGLKVKTMMNFLKAIYKGWWQIDEDLGIYTKVKKIININAATGYADLWLSKEETVRDRLGGWKNIRIKKLVKRILEVK